jgi:UDP-N-acetylglucosamine 2-epimerase
MKILSCTGIRPDFIRMSAVFGQLDARANHVLVHTGQHYETSLSDVFFKDLSIRAPDYNLAVGGPGKPHYSQVAELSVKLTELCLQVQPDVVCFLGDSNSVLASIPLHKEGFKVAHIEAGMRSYDRRMLEEANRVACDHASDMLFVYHENYATKARAENISDDRISVVGNTIVEPLRKIADLSYSRKAQHILLDIHRPENFKSKLRMEKIIEAASFYSKSTGLTVKMLGFSRTLSELANFGLSLQGIELVELMGYRDFIRFQQNSLFVFSDSGSSQEEAALLGVPVICPRDFTERPESMQANCSRLLALESSNFKSELDDSMVWLAGHAASFAGLTDWLGDGRTSSKIVDILLQM